MKKGKKQLHRRVCALRGAAPEQRNAQPLIPAREKQIASLLVDSGSREVRPGGCWLREAKNFGRLKPSRSVRCDHSHAGRIAPGFGETRDHLQATATLRIPFAGSPRKLAESPPSNSSRRGRTARQARR